VIAGGVVQSLGLELDLASTDKLGSADLANSSDYSQALCGCHDDTERHEWC